MVDSVLSMGCSLLAAETHHGAILCVEYGVGVLILGGRKFVFTAMMEETRKTGHICGLSGVGCCEGQLCWEFHTLGATLAE